MDAIGKFLSDVEKIVKKDRQNNGGKNDYRRFKKDLQNLFCRTSVCDGELPNSVYEYWENEYINKSSDPLYEPKQDNIAKLGAFLGFLNNDDQDEDLISDNDWQELGRLVNYEAEDMPIEVLQDLMKILVNHGAY